MIEKIYQKIIVNMFFLFFMSPILSPFINGKTFYIYWIIPLLDYKFIKDLLKIRIKIKIFYLLLILLSYLLCQERYEEILRIILIVYMVLYLKYLKKINYLYLLYRYLNLNILLAFFQFIFQYINPKISYMIGPTNISYIVWGKYAGPTFTNFYSIGLLNRSSGLSREVGFFSSLITITILIYIYDTKVKKIKIQKLLFLLGYIISIAKMSIILPVYFILKKLKNKINKIPKLIFYNGILIFFIMVSKYMNSINFYNNNISWTHRFGGYYVITKYNIYDLFFSNLETVQEITKKYSLIQIGSELKEIDTFTGLANIILHYGIFVYFVFILILILLRIDNFKYLLFVLLCFNTSFITVTSYIVLNYYFILELGERNEKKIKRLYKRIYIKK